MRAKYQVSNYTDSKVMAKVKVDDKQTDKGAETICSPSLGGRGSGHKNSVNLPLTHSILRQFY